MRKKSVKSMPICKGMNITRFASRGAIYLRLRVYFNNPRFIDRAIAFTRADYDEKWLEFCELSRKHQRFKETPASWMKRKPTFNQILKVFELNETAHYRYSEEIDA